MRARSCVAVGEGGGERTMTVAGGGGGGYELTRIAGRGELTIIVT